MEFSSVPLIVIISYLGGEIYKVLFKKNKKIIPIIVTLLGGLLGILIYLTNPEMIFNASNIYIALEIGLVSGASATGTNQIIKQMFYKEKEENNGSK